jgi:hypothetical protein
MRNAIETWSSLPHASFDLVIMNPPSTRPTGLEAKKIGVPNPMFAAFGSSDEEQRLMGQATKRLTNGTSAHGNAGEPSIFLVLADRQLKPNGVLALVMPVSLMSGDAWEKSRAPCVRPDVLGPVRVYSQARMRLRVSRCLRAVCHVKFARPEDNLTECGDVRLHFWCTSGSVIPVPYDAKELMADLIIG